MATVTLKDGSKVAETALITTRMNLEALHRDDYIAFFDLVEKCRNARHQINPTILGDSKAVLIEKKFMNQDEEVHDDVRKVVLNSFEGSGMNMRLVSPLPEQRISVVEENE